MAEPVFVNVTNKQFAEPRHRVCNNCSTVYAPLFRKCPTVGCRAPVRFSTPETNAQRDVRHRQDAETERFLQSLIREAARG